MLSAQIIPFPANPAFTRLLVQVMPDDAVRAQALRDADMLFTAYRIHRRNFARKDDDRETMLDAFREEIEKRDGSMVAAERATNVRLLVDTWESLVGSELDV